MACFLVIHRAPADFSDQVLLAEEKKVIRLAPREIKWLMSWFDPQQNEVISHWDAPTCQAVRATLEHAGVDRVLPLLEIIPVQEIYPKRYAARRRAARVRSRQTRSHTRRRVLTGAYAESIAAVLQTRGAT